MIQNKRILVTGGAGAIGSNLSKVLASAGNQVYVLDDLSSGYLGNIEGFPGIHFFFGSVADDKILKYIFSHGVDYVFHLAAHFANQNSIEHPRDDLETNGLGTLKLLEYSREYGVSGFLLTSTSCIQGNVQTDVEEGHVGKLDTPYAIHKLLGEYYVDFFKHHYKLPARTVRYFNVYGPGERPGKYRNVIPNFLHSAMKGLSLTITGTGTETRPFTYIDDIVRGTILVMEHQSTIGRIVNLGRGVETSVLELATLVNEITGNKAGIEFKAKRGWDNIGKRECSVTLAKQLVDFEANTDLKTGLQKTFEWIKTTANVSG